MVSGVEVGVEFILLCWLAVRGLEAPDCGRDRQEAERLDLIVISGERRVGVVETDREPEFLGSRVDCIPSSRLARCSMLYPTGCIGCEAATGDDELPRPSSLVGRVANISRLICMAKRDSSSSLFEASVSMDGCVLKLISLFGPERLRFEEEELLELT